MDWTLSSFNSWLPSVEVPLLRPLGQLLLCTQPLHLWRRRSLPPKQWPVPRESRVRSLSEATSRHQAEKMLCMGRRSSWHRERSALSLAVCVWNTKNSISFEVHRRWFYFTGKQFKLHEQSAAYKQNPVSMKLQPFTQGGMRFVYCFKDSTIPLYYEQRHDTFAMQEAGTDARMVAKLPKYADAWHNSSEIVSAHAHSSAVARCYSRIFRLVVMDRLGWEGRKMCRIIFVECYVYKAEGKGKAPAPFFVGERFLPGVFRKYNSNHGYVDLEAPESEVAQAFSHFTFQASCGKYMVLDLQGVHLDKAQRRKPHLILTDPQVVSVERSFGPGDLGEEGMRAFFRSHRCGATCKKLGLDQDAWKKSQRTARKDWFETLLRVVCFFVHPVFCTLCFSSFDQFKRGC